MNSERIKELQKFSDDFFKKLNQENETEEINDIKTNQYHKILKKSLSTCGDTNKKPTLGTKAPFTGFPAFKNRPVKSCRKKQSKFSNNIYKTLLPWVPPNYVPNYFEKYNRLEDHHDMSSWEKVIYLYFIIHFYSYVYIW